MKRLVFILLSLACILPARASTTAPKDFDFGPIISRHQDLHGDIRLRALGPFLEFSRNDRGLSLTAVHPFYSRVTNANKDKTLRYAAWPVYASTKLQTEAQWRFLLWYGFNHDYQQQEHRYRYWLFPFYYQGRDKQGEKYHALFPFYGSIHEVLGRDEINFVLFPIRSTSKLNDLRTSNWLWPFISRTTGDKVYRARVFPFYGVSKWEGKFEKRFVMWPIWNSVEYKYPDSHGRGFILFPLFGHMALSDQTTWWVIPPLFRFTHGARMDKVYCPWPFVQWTRGEVDKFYLWPLYGQKRFENVHTTFALWPIFWHERFDKTRTTRYRNMVIPFYFADTEVSNMTNSTVSRPVVSKYRKLWPLFSYRRAGDQSSFRMLELSPFPENPPVEYNWAPLWTIYSRATKGENRDVEFLWGLYNSRRRGPEAFESSLFPLYDWRRNSANQSRSWALLKGLIGYERQGSRRTFRLLYILRFGGKDRQP